MAKLRRATIVRESIDDAIRRLEVQIEEMEAAHGCSSQSVLDAVRAGRKADTPEVAEWLTVFQMLQSLKASTGSEVGTPTRITG